MPGAVYHPPGSFLFSRNTGCLAWEGRSPIPSLHAEILYSRTRFRS
ncbi:MAG TPA: hypothetical protein IGS37_12790 [Synechococcales cyanobacterium M55_K2018_004]|nr:hypothetical protein [Synechococcales cyanobacterium M55_K2018_004]